MNDCDLKLLIPFKCQISGMHDIWTRPEHVTFTSG